MSENQTAEEHKGLVSAGAALVWRRQGILWWVFAANLALGMLGTMPVLHALKGALGHSLAGEQMVKGFDLGMFYELTRLSHVNLMRFKEPSYLFAGLFAALLLFVSGGILETYRQDRRLNTGDFFAASGAFFWPFVRLMLFSLVPFVFLGNLYLEVEKWSDLVGEKFVVDQVGFLVEAVGTIVIVPLLIFVRLWFDIAKVRAVAQKEHRMWRNMWRALSITGREIWTLLGMYLRISLVAWIIALVGFLIWTKLPPTAIPATFILVELVLLVQVAARLWQMASAMTWYKRHAEMVPADTVDYTTPHPLEILEPTPQMPLYPETGLPPADA